MTILITDIDSALLNLPEGCKIVQATEERHHCTGCFGCWVKTPGECVIGDDLSRHGADMAGCSRLIVVSRCVYGGYSPAVKRVIDRTIPYAHPYFVTREGRMHHKRRYDNVFSTEAHFYGEITDAERSTAQRLVAANNVNFGCGEVKVFFHASAEELKEVRL